MKVGVLFPTRFEDPGEFLADARAMEAAGVDSVWMEDGDSLDPMLALAAIAAVTSQIRLGLIPATDSPSPARGGGLGRGLETLQHLSRQRVITDNRGWRRVEVPADREAWARTLEQARPDVDGVLVPMDPRLLDILRHPDEAIDRSDLQLAQG
jgi:alkanesulfonate monooxygenase SsuD/methylene tetrahydromethanopterin reductase-like flavin-dependent oxidoreductase (luciferase family)